MTTKAHSRTKSQHKWENPNSYINRKKNNYTIQGNYTRICTTCNKQGLLNNRNRCNNCELRGKT